MRAFYSVCEIQSTMNRIHWNDVICYDKKKENNKIERKLKWERDIKQTRRDRQQFRHFVQHRNALILCLLHLLLRFGQHPKLMVIIIAVTQHRLCRYSREAAVWHQLRKHCSCLTKHAFSYGSEMSRLTPINAGQENTEGLCFRLGRKKEASRAPVFFLWLLVWLNGVLFAF